MSLATKIHKAFKFRGLTARADAIKAVASVLKREPEPERSLETILDALQRALERHDGGSGVVDLETVTQVVAELTRDDEDIALESIQVLGTPELPKHVYNASRRTFITTPPAKPALHAAATAKIDMFRERYAMVEQRVLRNALFSPPVLGSARSRDKQYFKLTPVESLLGMKGTRYVLAMIVQPEEGSYCLEDITGRVPVDLSETETTSGLFTESALVLCQGVLREGVFHVAMMGFPPPERRLDALVAMGSVDPLGQLRTPQEFKKVKVMEEAAVDAMFVFLSDVHLDKPRVMDKLRRLFEGFHDVVPSMFIFCGNFMSTPFGHGADDRRAYTEHMRRLADLLGEFPKLCEGSRFVFVPGMDDPGGNVLPRAPIPSVFTGALREQLSHVTFATNPARIRFYTQEIVIFRQDLMSRMRRHCVLPPSEAHGKFEITEHLVRTVLDQGHLCPLPITVQPVHWALDHTLRLYPMPDVVILADSFESYHWAYEDCTVFNPGPFPDDFSFVVFRPSASEAEFSRIDR